MVPFCILENRGLDRLANCITRSKTSAEEAADCALAESGANPCISGAGGVTDGESPSDSVGVCAAAPAEYAAWYKGASAVADK